VYREEGLRVPGACLQECLGIELGLMGISFQAQVRVPLAYKGHPLSQHYIPDFVCYESIIVELKAVFELADEHRAQVLNYLSATGYKVGLPVNFGHHPESRSSASRTEFLPCVRCAPWAASSCPPSTSAPIALPQSYTRREQALRVLWGLVGKPLFRLSPRPCFAWRRLVLRLFGARWAGRYTFTPLP